MPTEATQRRQLPDIAKTLKEKQDLKARKAKMIETSIQRCLATKEGKLLMKYLMEQCGYQKGSVQASKSTGEHLDSNTQYNEGRRDLYLALRRLAREDTLIEVEIRGLVSLHELLG